MMKLTEEVFARIAVELTGSTKIVYQDQEIDLTPPWPRKPMLEAIKEYSGVDLAVLSLEEARLAAKEKGLELIPRQAMVRLWKSSLMHLWSPSSFSPSS